jgi:uncharacterized membrane protein
VTTVARALLVAAAVWPLLLAFALWERINHPSALTGHVLYLAASAVCHQIPERSFQTAGIPWPVCGRCAGLYVAAPFGAWLGLRAARRRNALRPWQLLAVSALPTVLTIAVEWLRPAVVGNVTRFVAALPLGAAISFMLLEAAAPPVPASDVHRQRIH